ncbi:MAG: hypothetical protein AAFV80_04460, partial [Bacteroidota bacterium]
TSETNDTLSSIGVGVLAKPTIALLGGFSSSFVYKLLNRIVEALNFLVGSETEPVKKAKEERDEAQKAYETQSERIKRYITEIQEKMADGLDTEDFKDLIHKMTDKFLPPVDTQKKPVSSAVSPFPEDDPEISEDEEKFRRFEYKLEVKGPVERINPN